MTALPIHDISCPECGGDYKNDLSMNLSTLGYKAQDTTFECEECGNNWACGKPVGEYDGPHVDDVVCDCCGKERGLLYQIHEGVNGLALRFKCPYCYYVWVIEREMVNGGITIGYEEVMGTIDDAKNWGYETEGD